MRPLQLTVMLQECKSTVIITLAPFLDKLIQSTYFVVDAIASIKTKAQMFVGQYSITLKMVDQGWSEPHVVLAIILCGTHLFI